MRLILALAASLAGASSALAHPGHFPLKDGHDHFVALAAFLAAMVIAAVAAYAAYVRQTRR
jgi:hypothetical protein